jgi:uncharacterized membrane protein YhhN
MPTISLLAFFVFAVTDWIAVSQQRTDLEHIAKPAALGALLIYASTDPSASSWLIAALALSLLGDVYLMLPGDRFIAGLSAFLLAHVAYIFAFDVSLRGGLIWLIVVLVVTAPLALRILGAITHPGLRNAVVIYMAVIGFMAASALASGSWLAALGAISFVASDLTIAWNRFVQPFAAARLFLIVTYHVGQWWLVEGLTR